jgi:hypothetical protein
MLVIKNIDHIFTKFKAPASRFPLIKDSIYAKNKNNNSNYINRKTIRKVLKTSRWLIDGGFVLIQPNAEHYKSYLKMMDKTDIMEYKSSNSGPDEYSLTKFMTLYKGGPNKAWANVGDMYSCVQWGSLHDCTDSNAYILNFYGRPKPWEKNNTFEDANIWRATNKDRINTYR